MTRPPIATRSLTIKSVTRRDLIALIGILLVAAGMRLGGLGVVSFQYDEAALSQRALDMLAQRTLPVVGIPSSVGVPNSPMSVYILAIPYALSADPLAATAFIALLNVIGVGLLWLLALRCWNRRVALLAGLAYAFNPWAVIYSRKIWEQDYHTPFLLLALLCGLYGYVESGHTLRHRLAQVLYWPILLVGLQIHFSAWALLPMFAWIVWLGRRAIAWRFSLIGLALGVLTLLPFGLGLSQALALNPQSAHGVLQNITVNGLSISARAAEFLAQFSTGIGLNTFVSFANPQTVSLSSGGLTALVMSAAVVAGALITLARFRRPMFSILLLWIIVPWLVFTPTWTVAYPHYFIASIPALSLLAALGVDGLVRWQLERVVLRCVLIGGFAAILVLQGLRWETLITAVDTHPTTGDIATPLHYLQTVQSELSKVNNVVIVSNDYWQHYDREPVVWDVLLSGRAACMRAVGGDGFAVFPQQPFAALITPRGASSPVRALYGSSDTTTFAMRPGEVGYTLARFNQPLRWSGPSLTPINSVTFDNGAQLTGYRIDGGRLYLGWTLTRSQGDDFQYFGHFLDKAGQRLSQVDTIYLPGASWCAGDHVVTWTTANVPDNAITVRVGMYRIGLGRDAGQFFASNVLNAAGSAVGQWVDIAR